jgi:hypothetical protein
LTFFKEKSLKQQIAENFAYWKIKKQRVEDVLNKAIRKSNTIQEFQHELSRKGVQAILHSNSGGVYGISFSFSGFEFKGSEIGKNYTWTALNRHFATAQMKVQKSSKSTEAGKQSGRNDSGKILPTIKLGYVSTAEDEWKREERRKKMEEEKMSEETRIYI